jgi:SAM-dependent methyltransferase
MAPALQPVAAEVVRRASLHAHDRVLDVGTGGGIAAAAAVGDGRTVVGVDVAEGMLELARRDVPAVSFQRMDFEQLGFGAGSFDVVVACHVLLFATDRVAALREWRRVVRPGGRLSLSVPGPDPVTPSAVYGEIYGRHGIHASGRYPTRGQLAAWAKDAGWLQLQIAADSNHVIQLPDEAAFRVWRSIGSRGAATADWSPEQHEALTREMLAVTPRGEDGSLRIPFGVLYLSASAS